MNAGLIIRAILMVIAAGFGVRLFSQAFALRREWSIRERGLEQAEAWWASMRARPFDREHEPTPEHLKPYLGPTGPLRQLHSPAPAQAQLVWGVVLALVALLLALSVVAQVVSGLS